MSAKLQKSLKTIPRQTILPTSEYYRAPWLSWVCYAADTRKFTSISEHEELDGDKHVQNPVSILDKVPKIVFSPDSNNPRKFPKVSIVFENKRNRLPQTEQEQLQGGEFSNKGHTSTPFMLTNAIAGNAGSRIRATCDVCNIHFVTSAAAEKHFQRLHVRTKSEKPDEEFTKRLEPRLPPKTKLAKKIIDRMSSLERDPLPDDDTDPHESKRPCLRSILCASSVKRDSESKTCVVTLGDAESETADTQGETSDAASKLETFRKLYEDRMDAWGEEGQKIAENADIRSRKQITKFLSIPTVSIYQARADKLKDKAWAQAAQTVNHEYNFNPLPGWKVFSEDKPKHVASFDTNKPSLDDILNMDVPAPSEKLQSPDQFSILSHNISAAKKDVAIHLESPMGNAKSSITPNLSSFKGIRIKTPMSGESTGSGPKVRVIRLLSKQTGKNMGLGKTPTSVQLTLNSSNKESQSTNKIVAVADKPEEQKEMVLTPQQLEPKCKRSKPIRLNDLVAKLSAVKKVQEQEEDVSKETREQSQSHQHETAVSSTVGQAICTSESTKTEKRERKGGNPQKVIETEEENSDRNEELTNNFKSKQKGPKKRPSAGKKQKKPKAVKKPKTPPPRLDGRPRRSAASIDFSKVYKRETRPLEQDTSSDTDPEPENLECGPASSQKKQKREKILSPNKKPKLMKPKPNIVSPNDTTSGSKEKTPTSTPCSKAKTPTKRVSVMAERASLPDMRTFLEHNAELGRLKAVEEGVMTTERYYCVLCGVSLFRKTDMERHVEILHHDYVLQGVPVTRIGLKRDLRIETPAPFKKYSLQIRLAFMRSERLSGEAKAEKQSVLAKILNNWKPDMEQSLMAEGGMGGQSKRIAPRIIEISNPSETLNKLATPPISDKVPHPPNPSPTTSATNDPAAVGVKVKIKTEIESESEGDGATPELAVEVPNVASEVALDFYGNEHTKVLLNGRGIRGRRPRYTPNTTTDLRLATKPFVDKQFSRTRTYAAPKNSAISMQREEPKQGIRPEFLKSNSAKTLQTSAVGRWSAMEDKARPNQFLHRAFFNRGLPLPKHCRKIRIEIDVSKGQTRSMYHYQCDLCKKTFWERNLVVQHLESVHEVGFHHCTICRTVLPSQQEYESHMTSRHTS